MVSIHALSLLFLLICCIEMQIGCLAFTTKYKDMDICPSCQSPRRDSNGKSRQFRYIPLKHRIRLMYANRSMAEILHTYRATLRNIEQDQISDVWQGEVMQSDHMRRLFEGNRDNERAITLQFALDGVQVDALQSNEVWPLICLNLNLPPSLRFCEDNILPLGITPGPNDPVDIDSFISPMVDELQQLSEDVQCYDAYINETFTLRVYIVICTGDTPAIAKLLSMKTSTAKHCCRFCHIKGKSYVIIIKTYMKVLT